MKLTSLLLATLLGMASTHAAVYTLNGNLDVSQAGTNGGFGGGTGNGSGTIIGNYDDVTNLLDYTITFSNLSGPPTNMHFHLGAPGVSGGVQLAIPSPWPSPKIATGVAVSEANEVNLLAGNWYLNVHTSAFPGGEIRGQVDAALVPEPSSALLLFGGLGALAIRRRRS